ncbi:MAG: hypothetical protein QXN74_04795 [Saccharolobus sp.]
MEIGDKILIMRGMMGFIVGMISTSIQSSILLLAWVVSFYIFSVIFTIFIFRQTRLWLVFGKGTAIFFTSWFLSLIMVYNLVLRG